jgi:SAM-dependent methyltransferase
MLIELSIIICFLLSAIVRLFSNETNLPKIEIQGGGNMPYFDPKEFVQHAAKWQISYDGHKWQPISTKNYQAMVLGHTKIYFKCGARQMLWQTYQELEPTPQTKYLRDMQVDDAVLAGRTGFLMTPYLREWQKNHILKWIPDHAHLFDIGIGTGRSRDMWAAKHLAVYGVEIAQENFAELMRKRIPQLRDARNWGGENLEIQKWMPPHSCDVVMMSYSITFFFESREKFTNLISNIKYLLKPGGRFICIGMDGDLVVPSDNECYNISVPSGGDGVFGRQIEITMKSPFSLVTKQTEYLVDFATLEREFKKVEFSQHVAAPFFLDKWPSTFVKSQKLIILSGSTTGRT